MKINFFSVLFYKIMFVLVTILSFSQNSENYFKAGNDFYNNGQFEKALDSYFKVLNENYHSAELYYNIGNTYYKLDSIANSIFYFEKAKKISPMDRDIINNLGNAENMISEGKRLHRKFVFDNLLIIQDKIKEFL